VVSTHGIGREVLVLLWVFVPAIVAAALLAAVTLLRERGAFHSRRSSLIAQAFIVIVFFIAVVITAASTGKLSVWVFVPMIGAVAALIALAPFQLRGAFDSNRSKIIVRAFVACVFVLTIVEYVFHIHR
jgi:Na+-transporting NADH:ubiquinone oxidoreductase subunit NqrB